MISDQVQIRTTHFFSISHAHTAGLMARYSEAAEIPDTEGNYRFSVSEHKAFIVSTIWTSVAMLEAIANEYHTKYLENFDPNQNLPENMQERNFKHLSQLEKYDALLTELNQAPFEKGQNPYQQVKLVILLRNFITHSNLVTNIIFNEFPDESVTKHEFETKLKGKFNENSRAGAGDEFFPKKCLSAGCARWAFESCIAFVGDFYRRLNSDSPFADIGDQCAEISIQ